MPIISTENGAEITVDDCDLALTAAHRWHISHNGYAVRRVREHQGPKRVIYLHREILGQVAFLDIDHADGDKLNNSRRNLRVATRTLNNANSKARVGCSSRYKGVALIKKTGRWWAYINKNRKRSSLGTYADEAAAACAYNAAAISIFGEFARLNPF